VARKKNKTVPSNNKFLSEVFAVFMLALATLIFMSIISFHPLDRTILNQIPEDAPTRNFIGVIGANIAAISMQIFGFSSFFIPLALFVIGGCIIGGIRLAAPIIKSIGLAGLILSSSILLTLIAPRFSVAGIPLNHSAGGAIGSQLDAGLISSVGLPGTWITAISVLLISLLLAINFSFKSFFSLLGNSFSKAQKNLSNRNPSPVEKKKKKSPKIIVKVKLSPLWGKKKQPEDELSLPEESDFEVKLGKEVDPSLEKFLEQAEEPEQQPLINTSDFQPEVKKPRQMKTVSVEELRGLQVPINFLDDVPEKSAKLNLRLLADQARAVVDRYKEFGIDGEVLQTNPGPVVNTFEFKPAPGIKYNKVVNLANELCLALKAISIRISRMAGKSTIGLEVPNDNRETIYLRKMLESPLFHNSASPLTLGLGKTITGEPYITCLEEMPHLLIGGATGTGKSVALNSMIMSILYKSPPETTRFIMVDPKQVELSLFEGIPHLLTPVVTHPKKASAALRWACEEMEVRYRKLAEGGVRNIKQYNAYVNELIETGGDEDDPDFEIPEPMPYIVIIIDELADLMMTSGNEVEESICRLAQKARAVGIHLIIATQRPSVDVLTGVIKANFPCRISFGVFSKTDSRVILDSYGAEDLLGKGDMLFIPPGTSRLIRLHGSFINEKEIKRIVKHLKKIELPEEDQNILNLEEVENTAVQASMAPDKDPLYDEALNLVLTTGVASISNLQRKMRLGYARAARIIDMMEVEGYIGPADGSKPREILKNRAQVGE
jgi:S-DNA-T family DNA segregation ATPase FtsK/SpoIIIE